MQRSAVQALQCRAFFSIALLLTSERGDDTKQLRGGAGMARMKVKRQRAVTALALGWLRNQKDKAERLRLLAWSCCAPLPSIARCLLCGCGALQGCFLLLSQRCDANDAGGVTGETEQRAGEKERKSKRKEKWGSKEEDGRSCGRGQGDDEG